jgi:hypothetical protein
MILKPRKHTKNPLRNAAHGDKRENRARNAVELRRFVEISREWANVVTKQSKKKNKNKNKKTSVFCQSWDIVQLINTSSEVHEVHNGDDYI